MADSVGMTLDHERLDVYCLALDFLVFAQQVLETLPRGHAHLSDQSSSGATQPRIPLTARPNSAPMPGEVSAFSKACPSALRFLWS